MAGDIARLEAEVARLNKWADGFSDAQMKERRLCEERIRELTGAQAKLRKTAALLFQNAVMAAGDPLPGWLADAKADIDAAASLTLRGEPQMTDAATCPVAILHRPEGLGPIFQQLRGAWEMPFGVHALYAGPMPADSASLSGPVALPIDVVGITILIEELSNDLRAEIEARHQGNDATTVRRRAVDLDVIERAEALVRKLRNHEGD